MNKDIFDTKRQDDLPPSMRREIRINTCDKILGLFELKEQLNCTEIMCALYRLHNLKIKRAHISSVVYALYKSKKLKRTLTRGIYALNK